MTKARATLHSIGGVNILASAVPALDWGVSPGWRIFWCVFAAIGVVAEGIALVRPEKGDTASETVWWLRGRAWGWRTFVLFAVCAWLGLHFGAGWFS